MIDLIISLLNGFAIKSLQPESNARHIADRLNQARITMFIAGVI